jgi:1-deoxy-D-xylulose-5-phosphate synthase
MTRILPELTSPLQLHSMSLAELSQLADEIRSTLCGLLSRRSAHFASNLGVVELCLALHSSFDFSRDRLIWDTGHQIYPHKLVTGRYHQFETIRTRGGLMGYPNPAESPYDLFVTGHAGCSVSTMVGIRSGDDLHGETDRHAVAVIGDGALPSGIVFEAFNNVAITKSNLLVILNDNEMSICPRVGGLANYLDRLRGNPAYTGFKNEVVSILNKVPLLGDPAERLLAQIKEGVKAGLHGGMMFEEFGFRYFGPIDGHNIGLMRKYLKMVKKIEGPVLLHVITRKGHGFEPAAEDPVFFHTPPKFCPEEAEQLSASKKAARAYTDVASEAIASQLGKNSLATVITAAMCQGNKLEPVRERFPQQFFDVGICESHAVAFAAGQAKTGCRPIVDIYSTFLQRSFDQIFQEVCLQNLPVTFMMDRAGLTATDGPTHHGTYDMAYMRIFPNMVVMAPGDAHDIRAMLDFAMTHNSPCSIRYPKDNAIELARRATPVELGRAEIIAWGRDGMILCAGTPLVDCIRAAEVLRNEGLEIGVINARFIKPLDSETIGKALREMPFVVTVEEGALMGGFGSAVLELGSNNKIDCSHVSRIGIPDRFVEHAERSELLADLRLDAAGVAATCRELASRFRGNEIDSIASRAR